MVTQELIDRVEAAVDPDRSLDADIAVAVDGGTIVWKQTNGTMEAYPTRQYASSMHVAGYGNAPVPAYTASVDAALSLLPEGWRWWKAGDSTTGGSRMVVVDANDKEGRWSVLGECPCPETSERNALALTTAYLRASLSQQGVGNNG